MLSDSLGQLYRKVIFLQTVLVSVIALVGLVSGGAVAAISGLVGGGAAVLGTVVYAILARESRLTAVGAKRVLGRHLLAESAKVATVLVLILAALASGWFAAGWLIAAMGASLLGHGLAVLVIR